MKKKPPNYFLNNLDEGIELEEEYLDFLKKKEFLKI